MEEKVNTTNEEITNTPTEIIVNKSMVLDTSNFIRLKPLNLNEFKYITTDFVVREIRDEKAREFFELNKNFITIKNPSRESMKLVTNFAKLSNDLKCLSIPDLSMLALSYELIQANGQEDLLRKEPTKYELVETVRSKTKSNVVKEETNEEDGFVEIKSKGKNNKDKQFEEEENDDEDEWITPENIDSKINKFQIQEAEELEIDNKLNSINVHLSTADFTVQNVAMKIGIPVMSIDGMKIRKIKNYVLKCYTCNNFIFDTAKLFCEDCGYNTLMKIGCSINCEGKLKIYDKPAEARNRGTQYDLPKPSLNKKGVVYILSEDQMPKKRHEMNLERDLEKILDNYENYLDFNPYKLSGNTISNTSKKFVWGFPKKNPNVPKKYYAKKQNK